MSKYRHKRDVFGPIAKSAATALIITAFAMTASLFIKPPTNTTFDAPPQLVATYVCTRVLGDAKLCMVISADDYQKAFISEDNRIREHTINNIPQTTPYGHYEVVVKSLGTLKDSIDERADLAIYVFVAIFFCAFLYFASWGGWVLCDRWRQTTGIKLQLYPDGVKVAARVLSEETITRDSIYLAPGVRLPIERDKKGICLLGMPGEGKSQVIKYLINQYRKRPKLRMLIIGSGKGDYEGEIPDNDFYLLAPHDERHTPSSGSALGVAWDIARDCNTPLAAAELAAAFIKISAENPMWGEGGRAILTGVIVGLQIRATQTGITWGFRELDEAVNFSEAELDDWLRYYYPAARGYFKLDEHGQITEPSYGFYVNYRAGVEPIVRPLALAWGDTPSCRRLSIIDWMKNPEQYRKSIILGHSGQYESMSRAWISAALRIFASVMKSPSFSDDDERRIMIIIDELKAIAQEGDPIASFKEFGRSKGFGFIIGVQTTEQLEPFYGKSAVASLMGLMETHIYVKVRSTQDGSGACSIASNQIGKGDFTRRVRINKEMKSEDKNEQIVESIFFADVLGRKGNKIYGAVVIGSNLCVLRWDLIKYKHVRPPCIEAKWITEMSDEDKKRFEYTAVTDQPKEEVD